MSKAEIDLLKAHKKTLESMLKFVASHPNTLSQVFQHEIIKSLNESVSELDAEMQRLEADDGTK